jgi:putative transcription factor
MEHQNWDTVIIRGKQAKPQEDRTIKSHSTTEVKKFGAGKNSNHTSVKPSVVKKLDDGEIVALPTVSKSLSQQIIAARQKAGLTQKELALKINEKPDIVKGYELGTAVPSSIITNKLQRALNTTFTK